MNQASFVQKFTITLTLIAGIAFGYWLFYDPVSKFNEFNPGNDNRPAEMQAAIGVVNIGAFFISLAAEPATPSSSWPRFRGSESDNISKQRVKLADSWGERGPRRLWAVDLGEGHSGPVVANGLVYVLDYDEVNRRDILRCFTLNAGAELWQRGYDIYIKRNHGMSRTVPAVQDSFVVSMGPRCQVMCAQAHTGAFIWGIDIEREFSSEVPLWYTGQCPLIDGDQVVLATGGDFLMVGIDLASGQVVWKTPNPLGWKMSHSSVMPMTLFGKRMYVYAAIGGILAVSAEAEDQGRLLFQSSEWSPTVVAPSPVALGQGKIFFTAGYGAGSALFQVNRNDADYTTTLLQTYKPDAGLCSEQQTPLFFQGHLFSILPKDAGARRNQFVCAASEHPENILWTSDKEFRFGLGPYLIADGKFFILSDEGVLTMAEATAKGFRILDRAQVLSGHDAWGPMAIVDGRLLCRDS
ncbi:MAG: hypothetical protein EHM72_00495, partial [Calditrichaeota bacterium]